jgi:ketosteroid isomerase-like protein
MVYIGERPTSGGELMALAIDELHDLIDERVAAVAARDGKTLSARQHPDVLAYGVLDALSSRGNDAVDEQMNAWFGAYREGPHYAVHDLHVDADGTLGYCAFIYHVTGTLNDGSDVSMAVRATLVCKRFGDRWLVVHDHESVPFDPATGFAMADLQPNGA